MSTQNKKQNRVLYVCLVLLLITASIFVAVASGAGRRSSSDASLLRETEMGNSTEPPSNDTSRTTDALPSHSPDTDESTEESSDASVPTFVSIDEIEFSPPLDGTVIVPCSITSPIYSLTMNDFRTHGGVDIKAEAGTPVCACASGEITEISDDPMMGTTVVISHADGIDSVYRNLASELPSGITVGASVAAGDTVGAVGDTALVECELEPHLHLELRVNGSPVDPSEHLYLASADTEYEG